MKKSVLTGVHLLLWILLVASNASDLYTTHSDYIDQSIRAAGMARATYALLFTVGYVIVFIVAFYGAYFLVGPYLFLKKRYLRAALWLAFVLVAMVATRYAVEFWFLLPYLKFHNYFGKPIELLYYAKNCIFFTYKYCLLGLVAYFLTICHRVEKQQKELEKEKIAAELAFLKSQTNPHFLFNTLNDIYALTCSKDDQAPVAVLKLSSLIRYMLYEGDHAKIPLERELDYIHDYVELQRIGSKHTTCLELRTEGQMDGCSVEPLLIIPLVENMFKHGVTADPKRPARVMVRVEGGLLQVRCTNALRHQHKDATPGIGLQNVRRRLELLYKDRHSFRVEQQHEAYSCFLDLVL